MRANCYELMGDIELTLDCYDNAIAYFSNKDFLFSAVELTYQKALFYMTLNKQLKALSLLKDIRMYGNKYNFEYIKLLYFYFNNKVEACLLLDSIKFKKRNVDNDILQISTYCK